VCFYISYYLDPGQTCADLPDIVHCDPHDRLAPAELLSPSASFTLLVMLPPLLALMPTPETRTGRPPSCASCRAEPRSAWRSVSRWRRSSR